MQNSLEGEGPWENGEGPEIPISVISDSATPWTVAHQAPLSMGILQARILEWVACPSPGDLPDPGMEPGSPTSW